MRIVEVRIRPFCLALARPLVTSRGSLHRREGVWLGLVDEEGRSGWGEASPLPGFHAESADECAQALGESIDASWCRSPLGLAERLAGLDERIGRLPSARGAVDGALHDLAARSAGVRVADLLAGGGGPRTRVPVNVLLDGREPDQVARSAEGARSRGFRTAKLKLLGDGTDPDRVEAARRALGPGPTLRLDANGGLGPAAALELAERVAPLDIEWIEQPLEPGRIDEMARLRELSPVALAADEDALSAASLAALLSAGAADWIVVKPGACGGPSVALDRVHRARAAGVGAVVTSFLDTAVGRRTALHVAAALPGPLPACGLATGDWLEEDLARDPVLVDGSLELPSEPGLGIHADAAAPGNAGSEGWLAC